MFARDGLTARCKEALLSSGRRSLRLSLFKFNVQYGRPTPQWRLFHWRAIDWRPNDLAPCQVAIDCCLIINSSNPFSWIDVRDLSTDLAVSKRGIFAQGRLYLCAVCKCLAGVAGVTFSDSAPVPKFLNPGGRKFFKFKNPTPVQTPASIDPNEIQQCFETRNAIYNDHANTCCCRKWKVTPGSGPVFRKCSTPAPVSAKFLTYYCVSVILLLWVKE